MSSAKTRVAAVVVAGGDGRRMGGGVRKQYLEIRGVPLLLRAVRPFLAHSAVAEVVVVLPPDDLAAPPPWLEGAGVRLAAGGVQRGDSVRNGLLALESGADVVLVHDGARPFATADVIDRVIAGCLDGWGAVAAVPMADTLQEVDARGRIVATPDRGRFRRAQTPQGFPRAALLEAYRRAAADGWRGTDDAAVFARAGGRVRVVAGAERNLKVTTPEDLRVAEALAVEEDLER
jgi:2-C-methyl-D-erythritol 4-phosphate cytidylyltransferase